MPTTRAHLRVFVASSRDVMAERERMPDVVRRVNELLAPDGPHLDLWRWETDAVPGLHEDGVQALINPDLDASDIVVLIVWTRFGPGTAEEVERTLERWKTNPKTTVLLPYFCDRPVSPAAANLDDLKKVQDTRKMLEDRALLGTYERLEDFEQQVERHLFKVAKTLASGRTG